MVLILFLFSSFSVTRPCWQTELRGACPAGRNEEPQQGASVWDSAEPFLPRGRWPGEVLDLEPAGYGLRGAPPSKSEIPTIPLGPLQPEEVDEPKRLPGKAARGSPAKAPALRGSMKWARVWSYPRGQWSVVHSAWTTGN